MCRELFIYPRNWAQVIKMVISWRFNYMFSLLPLVIKETTFKESLWDDGSLGGRVGWSCTYGGPVWGPANLVAAGEDPEQLRSPLAPPEPGRPCLAPRAPVGTEKAPCGAWA